jgi:membrane-bound lytic murein transglycosylase D
MVRARRFPSLFSTSPSRSRHQRQPMCLRRCVPALLIALSLSITLSAQQPRSTATAPRTPVPAATQTPAVSAQDQYLAQQHAQKVQDLVNRAHASYVSGVNNYNSNKLDAARTDFDNAVDLMLSSGMDLKNDPQLSDEFERLLTAINSLEIVALKQGNGFSPKVEETPLDVASNEVTFAPDPALIGKIAAELKTTQSDLPLTVNEYVAGFIRYYSNSSAGHAHLVRSLERAGKYQAMISRVLAQYGVPQDLIYLAVAESGFQPQVLNRSSGAGGMWQFMPFANSYGLTRNGYFDERFDPEKSTIAYAKYMKSLYNQFGDWYLAMAAYDWGPGYVQRAVQRTGYADFWELYRLGALPAETRNYVPGILAAAIMAKNPQQYGLTGVVPEAPILSDTVNTDYAIDLRLVADLTGATVPEIVALNPALLRLSTPRDISYDLHLPPGTKDTYLTRIKDIPEEDRTSWRFHVVKTGETLDTIAASFHVSTTTLASYNEVTPAQPMEAGDELVIPVSSGSSASPGQQRYTVHRGDTLVTVADRFGITVEQIREWNPSMAARLTPGRSIYVAEPVHLAPGMRRHGAHASSAGRRSSSSRSSYASSRTSSRNSGRSTAHSASSHAAGSSSRKRRR